MWLIDCFGLWRGTCPCITYRQSQWLSKSELLDLEKEDITNIGLGLSERQRKSQIVNKICSLSCFMFLSKSSFCINVWGFLFEASKSFSLQPFFCLLSESTVRTYTGINNPWRCTEFVCVTAQPLTHLTEQQLNFSPFFSVTFTQNGRQKIYIFLAASLYVY